MAFIRRVPAAGRWGIAAVTAVAVILAATGVLPRWPGLVHAVAVPPLDVAFDLRVLLARAPSYPLFALGLAVSLGIRVAVLAAILRGLGRPRPMRRAAIFYGAVLLPLLAGASLEWSGYAAVYHWYFWAGLGVLVATAVAASAAPFGDGRRFQVGRVLTALVALALLGAAARSGPWAAVALVPVSAAVTLSAIAWLIGPPPSGGRPASVTALAALLVAAIVVPARSAPPADRAGGAILLLVSGVDTSSGRGPLYRFDPTALGYDCRHVRYYSYRGPGRGAARADAACPLRGHAAYEREDTQAPLHDLVRSFTAHLRELRRAHPRSPVVVVTHSQGAWIAWRALARGGAMGVTHLVMLGMFPRSAASYPPPGLDGPGRVGADGLRLLSAISHELDTATFDPDAPLARETLAQPRGIEAIFDERLPATVRAMTIFSSLDVAVAPEGWSVPGAVDGGAVDATHAGMPESPVTLQVIRRLLLGQGAGGGSALADVLAWTLPAWGPPPDG